MATHSSILAWRIPWTQQPGRPWSMRSQRGGHNWSDLAHMHVQSESRWHCYCSVAQWCPTLQDLMDCSMPGFPVLHHLLESPQTQVHWVSDAVQHHPTTSSSVVPFSSCPQSLPASRSFPMSQLFTWGGQSIGVSASASVLPMNTQDWSPSGWTGWISLQSKALSRVFSNTTVQKH